MRRSTAAALLAMMLVLGSALVASGEHVPATGATPQAECGPGSHEEEGIQGRVSAEEIASGRAAEGYTCNTEQVSRIAGDAVQGGVGGYRVFRYEDAAGHECGYYDSTLLYPLNAAGLGPANTGVHVLDMSDSAKPVKKANLLTPAMQSPHESLSLNEERGLLAAVMGYPTFQPGIVDVYDISQNCLEPVLKSSTPLGIFGHEGTFSPDGNTYWATSTRNGVVTAVDVSDPTLPSIAWIGNHIFHGLNISDDNRTLYAADLGRPGLTILDVSEVQDRVPNPSVPVISHLTWPNVSIPQTAIPVTIGGDPYLVEVDEFQRDLRAGDPNSPVGGARIIDIANPAAPHVVSNIRLEVNEPAGIAESAGDPGATFQVQGYAGHYCAVPQREEPGIVACTFILSGLRVFDIRDPEAPVEIAYFNGPIPPTDAFGRPGASHAMSAPAFDAVGGEIWYSDGATGFYAVRLTNGVWPF